jgi:hypothetical protein
VLDGFSDSEKHFGRDFFYTTLRRTSTRGAMNLGNPPQCFRGRVEEKCADPGTASREQWRAIGFFARGAAPIRVLQGHQMPPAALWFDGGVLRSTMAAIRPQDFCTKI